MAADILAPIQRALALLGVSTGMVLTVAIVTVFLTVAVLSGHGIRLGIWLEDRFYRN